jgi:glycosyltransferase involved in cell wall biosynthesis
VDILITSHFAAGADQGASGVTMRLAREYARAGHRVALLSLDALPAWLPEKWRRLVFPARVAMRLAATAARGRRYDVVDSTTGDGWLLALLPGRVGARLTVVRSHGLEHLMHRQLLEEARAGRIALSWRGRLYHGDLLLRTIAIALRGADLALFLNRSELALAIGELGVDPGRARVVSNGLPERFIGREAPRDSASAPVLRIAWIGRYTLEKGAVDAAPAVRAVLERHPDAEISFLGTMFPPERTLADFPAGLHGRIRVVPTFANDDLPGLLQGHHINLFPTLVEGSPVSLLEAMACGLASVASDVPGPADIATDGVDALLVPARDGRAIERALDRLIGDRALLDRIRRAAHARAQAFAWPAVAGAQLELFRELLDHGATTAGEGGRQRR